MPVVSQNTMAITLPVDGCVLNFFEVLNSGTQALPTDDSDFYSLAHLQSSDAKENHLLT